MVRDVYFLVVHPPYETAGAVPVNGTIVHAMTLLHPGLPQPGAGRVFRCLTEFPGRTPGCLVTLADLAFELDGGRLWPQVADPMAVASAVVRLTRTPGSCEPVLLSIPEDEAALLAAGIGAASSTGPGPATAVAFGRLLDRLASRLPAKTGETPLCPETDCSRRPKTRPRCRTGSPARNKAFTAPRPGRVGARPGRREGRATA